MPLNWAGPRQSVITAVAVRTSHPNSSGVLTISRTWPEMKLSVGLSFGKKGIIRDRTATALSHSSGAGAVCFRGAGFPHVGHGSAADRPLRSTTSQPPRHPEGHFMTCPLSWPFLPYCLQSSLRGLRLFELPCVRLQRD